MTGWPTIPAGFGYPLVDMATKRLPQATMDAVAAETAEQISTPGTESRVAVAAAMAAVQADPESEFARQSKATIDEVVAPAVAVKQDAATLDTDTAALVAADTALGIAVQNLIGNYQPETLALLGRMTVRPDMDHRDAIDTLIAALKGAGIWTKLDNLHLLAAHDGQAALLNWKGAARPLVAFNSPAFTVDRGMAGDGATSYIRTETFSMVGLQAASDNHSMGVWTQQEVASVTQKSLVFGTSTTGGSGVRDLNPRTATDVVSWRIGFATTQTSVAHVTGSKFVAMSRNATDGYEYREGALDDSFTAAVSDNLTSANQCIVVGRAAAVFSTRRHAAVFSGAYLSDAEQANLYNALADYMTALGAL